MSQLETYLSGNLLSWTVPMMIGLPFTGFAYRAPEGQVVWIDPPEAGEHEAALLALGKPAHILVTFRDHDRGVKQASEAYGAEVWIPAGEGGSITPVHHEFTAETKLPAGLRALSLPACGYGEHALVGEAYGQRFAFIGDAVFNLEGTQVPTPVRWLAFKQRQGPLSMKRSYRGGETRKVPDQMNKLLDEKLDALFLSHGAAIPHEADRWLRACLGETK